LRDATRCQNTCRRIPHIATCRAYRSIWQWAKTRLSCVPFPGRGSMLLGPPIAWSCAWIIRAGHPFKVRLLAGRSALCARFSFHRRCTVASGLHTGAIGTFGLSARAKGSGSGSLGGYDWRWAAYCLHLSKSVFLKVDLLSTCVPLCVPAKSSWVVAVARAAVSEQGCTFVESGRAGPISTS